VNVLKTKAYYAAVHCFTLVQYGMSLELYFAFSTAKIISLNTHNSPRTINTLKALFIVPTDAHNYKIIGILKQLKFP